MCVRACLLCMCVFVYVRLRVYMSVCVCVCVRACVRECVRARVCTYVCMQLCINENMNFRNSLIEVHRPGPTMQLRHITTAFSTWTVLRLHNR